LMTIKGH